MHGVRIVYLHSKLLRDIITFNKLRNFVTTNIVTVIVIIVMLHENLILVHITYTMLPKTFLTIRTDIV